MDFPDLVIRWTIRAAMALYAAVLLARTARKGRPLAAFWRWVWLGGAVLTIVHIVCVFQFVHHWRHELAVAHTEAQVRETLGLAGFGWGVFANYVFAVLWLGDAIWWCIGPAAYERRPRWLECLVQGFLLLIVVNGAIVFASGPTRYAGLVCIAAWLAIAAANRNVPAAASTGDRVGSYPEA